MKRQKSSLDPAKVAAHTSKLTEGARPELFLHEGFLTRRLDKLIRENSGGVGLDAGCGEGAYLGSFRGEVVALDAHMPSLREAKGENDSDDISFVHGDIRHLPFCSGVFDFVLSADVVEHIPDGAVLNYLDELQRVSKGLVLLETANMSLFQEVLRAVLYRHRIHYGRNQFLDLESDSPLEHHSVWSVERLRAKGFRVHGCLGWVTRKYIRSKFVANLYDLATWNHPNLAGTIIGIKNRKKKK